MKKEIESNSIAMCRDKDCPISEKCYRTQDENLFMQELYFIVSPYNKEAKHCKYFIEKPDETPTDSAGFKIWDKEIYSEIASMDFIKQVTHPQMVTAGLTCFIKKKLIKQAEYGPSSIEKLIPLIANIKVNSRKMDVDKLEHLIRIKLLETSYDGKYQANANYLLAKAIATSEDIWKDQK